MRGRVFRKFTIFQGRSLRKKQRYASLRKRLGIKSKHCSRRAKMRESDFPTWDSTRHKTLPVLLPMILRLQKYMDMVKKFHLFLKKSRMKKQGDLLEQHSSIPLFSKKFRKERGNQIYQNSSRSRRGFWNASKNSLGRIWPSFLMPLQALLTSMLKAPIL